MYRLAGVACPRLCMDAVLAPGTVWLLDCMAQRSAVQCSAVQVLHVSCGLSSAGRHLIIIC